MKSNKSLLIIALLFLLIFSSCSENQMVDENVVPQTNAPVFDVSKSGPITEWLIVGPFPNPETDSVYSDGSSHFGFYNDLLQEIGGESKAEFSYDKSIIYYDDSNTEKTMTPQKIKAEKYGVVSLDKLYGNIDYKGAYGFCYIYSDKDQEAFFFLGSDDDAKVWINGQLVFRYYGGRGLYPFQDKFTAKLHKGLNRILVKNTDRQREWGFSINVNNSEDYAKIIQKEREVKDQKQFLNCRIVPQKENPWDFTFKPGAFPEMGWDKPYLVEKVAGKIDSKIRWFDNELNEVTKAAKPGRYAFVYEGTAANGMTIRRSATLYCSPWDWLVWAERPDAHLDYIPVSHVDKTAWENHSGAISKYMGRMLVMSVLQEEEGAVLMSYLDEIKPDNAESKMTATPIIYDMDYHLALKRKVLGIENKYPALMAPTDIASNPALILHDGTAEEALMKPGAVKELRKICNEWYEDSGEPFVACVARKGVIVFHEAFGKRKELNINTESVFPLASITKLITGTLFGQFIDQGLVAIDDPVGKYLHDFPVEGKKAITLRHCFTHTSGLYGHEEWRGLHNAYMENTAANALALGVMSPGKTHNYSGMGYNLAGKVMEMVSGKSIFRLFRENLFNPLGLETFTLEEDLGFSANCTAGELAVIGQLLLNGGSYGSMQFFTPETFEQMTPKSLSKYYPGINVDWGIGLTWMNQPHPEAGQPGIPDDETILSKRIVGHGSATASILNIDLDNDLVITMTRYYAGKNYDEYRIKFLKTIDENLID